MSTTSSKAWVALVSGVMVISKSVFLGKVATLTLTIILSLISLFLISAIEPFYELILTCISLDAEIFLPSIYELLLNCFLISTTSGLGLLLVLGSITMILWLPLIGSFFLDSSSNTMAFLWLVKSVLEAVTTYLVLGDTS